MEPGCGPGDLWSEREDCVPEGWDITLTDFSSTMLSNARRNLRHVDVTFEQFNANAIPIEGDTFDAVITKRLLFYAAGWESGIAEMAQVLKPGGKLCASTKGENHLSEFSDLVAGFDPEADFWGIQPAEPFYLENGSAEISKHFSQVETRHFDDHLEVDEADPRVDFVLSTNAKSRLAGDRLIAFIDHVESLIEANGKISKTKGLFVAHN
ncbi:MAG: class I SAM-dependent methyltransferase [Candidatus Latescibacterota bacterium]|nr:class I SAM-dependent methyltransferase [Candidatus Latescibacterota bacterium]